MTERTARIRAHLERVHAETWPVLAGLPADRLELAVYNSEGGTWTVKDLLGHLADSEAGLLGQAQRLVSGEQTVPADFDLARWNRSAVRRAKEATPAGLLERILAAHRASLDFLDTLRDDQLELVGRHSSGAMLSTERFLLRIADHRAEHVADIRAALARG
ncbi:MAG TPA: DinB family protein [Anaerolineales bacterium]